MCERYGPGFGGGVAQPVAGTTDEPCVISFVFGTTAELIKLAPIAERLDDRGVGYRWWCTGQQLDELPSATDALGLRHPDRWLGSGWEGRSLRSAGEVTRWAARLVRRVGADRSSLRADLRADGRPPLVVVHGDTMTTVFGAVLGRSLGATVAHVEAGMRSGDWRNPFPEELDRRAVARIADVHFASGPPAVANLRRARGVVVDTGANTVVDALHLRSMVTGALPAGIPDRFGLVSLHRSELYANPNELERTLIELAAYARRSDALPLLFVDHPVTCARLTRLGLDPLVAPLVRLPKQGYATFLALVRRSEFVVTDSGGLQVEAAELGVPCCVHRRTTESVEGLGANVMVSGFDEGALKAFLDEPARYRRPALVRSVSPSDVIVSWLVDNGFCAVATSA